jgi:hypothetical protein
VNILGIAAAKEKHRCKSIYDFCDSPENFKRRLQTMAGSWSSKKANPFWPGIRKSLMKGLHAIGSIVWAY